MPHRSKESRTRHERLLDRFEKQIEDGRRQIADAREELRRAQRLIEENEKRGKTPRAE